MRVIVLLDAKMDVADAELHVRKDVLIVVMVVVNTLVKEVAIDRFK